MRRSVVAALGVVLALSAGGCPQPSDSFDDTARLSVTDTLRTACQPLDDSQILQLVLLYEQSRNSAVPYEAELGFALSGCQAYEATGSGLDGIPESYTCGACAVAILSQVYGVEDGTPLEVAVPMVAPSGGRFSTPQDIQITCTTPGAAIYYTIDGTDPTAGNGILYANPVHLEATTTLRAVAKVNWTFSPVTSAEFVRQYLLSVTVDGLGTVTPESGLYDAGTQVQLQATPGAGWHFDHWEGHAAGEQPIATLTLDGDMSAKACFQTDDPDLVLIDALIVGDGEILIDPVGLPVNSGYAYATGTVVHLEAVEHAGALFMGWYTESGTLASMAYEIDLTLAADTYVIALFQAIAPPVLPVPTGSFLVASDGQYLGEISTNAFAANSLANPYGTYGNKYAQKSIWNRYGTYGNQYGLQSPYNHYTNTPPMIVQNGVGIGYLTKNTWKTPRIDPDDLAVALGRYDVLRN